MKTAQILAVIALVSLEQVAAYTPVIKYHQEKMSNPHFQKHILEENAEIVDARDNLVQIDDQMTAPVSNMPPNFENVELDIASESQVNFAMDQYKSAHNFWAGGRSLSPQATGRNIRHLFKSGIIRSELESINQVKCWQNSDWCFTITKS